MSDRFFLDTNIFVYSLAASPSAKKMRAAELVERAILTGNGVTSFQVVQEFFNVAFRRFNPRMTFAEAEQYMALTFAPLLTVQSSQALYLEALTLSSRYSLSWYDSVIVAAAAESMSATLYSEDFQDGQKFGALKVKNPFTGI